MKKKSERKPNSHHDLFFKVAFQFEPEALRFVEGLLPESFVRQMDKTHFELDNTTYVDEALKPSYSDICYITRQLSKKLMRVNILFEHKSHNSKNSFPEHLQIAIYKSSIWRLDLLNGRKPTFVLAVLLHHGKRKYKPRKFADCFTEIPSSWRQFVDDIQFVVVDLNRISDDEILKKLGGSIMACVLLAMKHAHEPKYFQQNFSKVFNFEWRNYSKEQIDIFIRTFFYYLETVTKMETHQN